MPQVSVIVPNYNHAPYLRQRLDSIFNQTFQDFEVIILDDCSTDNSKEIIEEYRNKPQVSHIIYNETNSGSPFKQWAKGFDLAQGDYIWIAESDDWAESFFLDNSVNILKKDPSLSFVFCSLFCESQNTSKPEKFLEQDFFFKGLHFLKKYQIFANAVVNASSVLFRRQTLTFIPEDFQNFTGSGDYLFWSYLCEHGNVYFSSKLLNHFRRHQTTTTSKNIASGNNFLENFRIYEYFKKKGYVSALANFQIIDYELSQIELNKEILTQNNKYTQCKYLWEKELKKSDTISQILLFFAKKINKHKKQKTIAKIWDFLHLPNTNFKARINHLFHKY